MRTALAAFVFLSACGSKSDGSFGSDFLLGTAIAGFQTEMGCPTLPPARCEDRASDWYAWITTPALLADPNLHLSGDQPSRGPGFYELYEADLDRAAHELHGNALRLSIEWSRVFPTATDGLDGESLRAAASADALAWYHAVFKAMRARGLQPFVTLHHYTLPAWIHDAPGCHQDLSHCAARGWLDKERIVREIAKYAGFVAREFGGEVDLWATLNEPFTAVVLAGFVLPSADRSNPPGVTLRWAEAKAANQAMIEAHARMADAVHANDTVSAFGGKAAQVGIVYNLQSVSAADPKSLLDQTAARNLAYLMNEQFLNGALKGDLDANLDGQIVHRPDLGGKTDFLGINYYVRATAKGLVQPYFPTEAPLMTFDPFALDLRGDASGIGEALAAGAKYGLPIYVTETGIEDLADSGAAESWIGETLWRVQQARASGVPVRGYFYWTLMDNYEWNHGMTMRLGLYAVDPADASKRRTARPRAAGALARIAAARSVPPDLRPR